MKPSRLNPFLTLFGIWSNIHGWASRSSGVIIPVYDPYFTNGDQDAISFLKPAVGIFGVQNVEQHDKIRRSIRQAGAVGDKVALLAADIGQARVFRFGLTHFYHLRVKLVLDDEISVKTSKNSAF